MFQVPFLCTSKYTLCIISLCEPSEPSEARLARRASYCNQRGELLSVSKPAPYIAATKVSAGLKLEKAAIASSKKTPWHNNHCHEREKYTTSRSNSVLQRILMRKCEFQSRVRISTFRLSAFSKRIPMRKRESTFRHPFGDYNIIKE